MHRKLLTFCVSLCALVGLPLMGQSYQTSFGPQTHDRAKAPSTWNAGIAQVDSATGALSIRIPLGPGIGARGLNFTPTFIRRVNPQASVHPITWVQTSGWWVQGIQSQKADDVELSAGLGGVLRLESLSLGVNPAPRYMTPDGTSGNINATQAFPAGLFTNADLPGILASFGYSSDVVGAKEPFGDISSSGSAGPTSTPWIRRGSEGELMIPLYSPSSMPGMTFKCIKGPSVSEVLDNNYEHYPNAILIVRGDVAYEYVCGADGGYEQQVFEINSIPARTEVHPVLKYVNYALARMMNRFGDVIDFTNPESVTFHGSGGETQMIARETFSGTPIIDDLTGEITGHMDDGYTRLTYQTGGQPLTFKAVGRTSYWGSILCEETGETIQLGWSAGPSITVGNETALFPRLGFITLPGRTISFTWGRYKYRSNIVSSNDGWAGYVGSANNPSVNECHDTYSDGVTEVVDKDTATGVQRTTQYTRVLPEPIWTTSTDWSDRRFHVITTHPDGRKTIQFYAQPLSGPVGMGTGSIDEQFQSLAHLKHVVKETRELEASVDAVADAAKTAAQSSAYQITLHDRFDIRSIGNTEAVGTLFRNVSCVPYPTRTRTYNRETGVMVVQEQTDWDTANFGWKTQYTNTVTGTPDLSSFEWQSLAQRNLSYSAPSGQVASSLVNRAYSSDRGQWLLGRLKLEQTIVGQDSTIGSIEPLGGSLTQKTRSYDNESGLQLSANRLTEEKLVPPSGPQVTTTLNYKGHDRNQIAPQLENVQVTGTQDLTAPPLGVGVQTYGYDEKGRLTSIQLKGVSWNVQQSYDAFNRPHIQTDANDQKTTYTWDAAGRLTGIAPQDLQATSIAYDSDFMGATVTRGAQKTQYRYNGYGQVIRVARWDASGASHQSIGYYPDGRKRWESIWLTGTGNDSEWTSTTAPGAATTYEYDGQGRVTKVIDPNGVATQTAYNGLSRTVTVGGIVTTYVSDAKGRLVQVLSPALADGTKPLTVYKYDKADRIARVEQYPNSANGVGSGTAQIREWKYNSLGWLVLLDQPESGVTYYTDFYVTGKAGTTIYGLPRGWRPSSYDIKASGVESMSGVKVTKATFDSLGRVLSVVGSDVNQSFVYDQVDAGGRAASSFGAAQGKLIYSRDKGIELFRTYSGMGGAMSAMDTRIWADGAVNSGTSWVLPQTFTTDSYGNRTQSTAGRSVVDTFYDLSKGLPSGLGRNGTTVMTATLDAVAWNVAGLNYGTNWGTSFSYDSDQTRLHAMNHLTPGKAPVAWTYSYDAANRLTGDGEDAYSYDNLGRLVSATVTRLNATTGLADPTRKMVESYSYDAFGNMTKKTATGTKPTTLNEFAFTATEIGLMAQTNRLPASTGASYDVQGNLTQVRTKSGATIKLTYDALARVIVCFDSSRQVQERYFYTPEGLRTLVEEWNTTGTTLNKRRVNLYNDARQLVSQYEVAAATQTLKTLAAQSTSVRAAVLVEPCGASIDAPESGTVYTKGTAISFRGSSDTYGATLSWNFGDGKSGSGAAPSHAYAAGGTYTVKLTASATGWANSVSTISVVIVDPTVQAPVISSFTSSSATLMPGNSATLAWSVTGATSLKINSSAVTGTSLSVSPTRTTVYTLVATNTKGSTSATVTINMPPVITFTASPAVISPGQSSTLSWSVVDATSVSYNGGSSSTALTGSATVTPSGNTEYKVTASNAVGSTTASIAVVLDVPGLTWKRDIIYLGAKEAAEFDANGMHVTQVDHLGSPRIVTNSTGAVELRQKYLPYGEALDTVALLGSLTTAKGFTNHEQTDASGLIYMQARFYLPQYGRFGSPDPARDQHFEQTQSWNIYSYVQNCPTMATDPTGMLVFLTAAAKDEFEKDIRRGLPGDEGKNNIDFTKQKDGTYSLDTKNVDKNSSDLLKGLDKITSNQDVKVTVDVVKVSSNLVASPTKILQELQTKLGTKDGSFGTTHGQDGLVSTDSKGNKTIKETPPAMRKVKDFDVKIASLNNSPVIQNPNRPGKTISGSALTSGTFYHEMLGHVGGYLNGGNYVHGIGTTNADCERVENAAQDNYSSH